MKRILVADDEAACQSIVRLMTPIGIKVDYATSGQDAFDMLCSAREEGHPYDMILLDWKMPQLNGFETARLIREKYSDEIPILLLTAYDWNDIEQEAMEIGIQHFMPKPFFLSTFKNVVGRIMDDANKKEEKERTTTWYGASTSL